MAFPDGWGYRKSITLSRATGAVTDYQMNVKIGKSSSATGEDVDCEDHCEADFDDLRFTTDDETTLIDYYIVGVTGSGSSALADVWIEFDSIGTGSTTFHMYYGNSGASAASDADDTFIFYEDFEALTIGDIDGQHGWADADIEANEHAEVVAGKHLEIFSAASADHTAYAYRTGSGLKKNLEITLKARFTGVVNCNYGYLSFREGGTSRMTFAFYYSGDFRYYDSSWHTLSTATGWTTNTWYDVKLIITDDDEYDIHLDGSLKQSNAGMQSAMSSGINQAYMSLASAGQAKDNTLDINDIRIRHYLATEPAWGSWGSEESLGATSIKTICGVAIADVKKVNGVAIADIKQFNGVSNVS